MLPGFLENPVKLRAESGTPAYESGFNCVFFCFTNGEAAILRSKAEPSDFLPLFPNYRKNCFICTFKNKYEYMYLRSSSRGCGACG